MEKLSKEKLSGADANEKVMEQSAADTPAEEIQDNRDVETDSETDSDSDSDSDSEFECDVCNKKMSSYLVLKQHQKGKKHSKAVLRKKKEKQLKKTGTVSEDDEELLVREVYASCKPCNKEFFDPEPYQQHLKCKKHKKNVLVASILEQVQEDGKVNTDKLRDLCKSKQVADDVFEDAKEKIMSLTLEDEDEKEAEEFECKECEKMFSGFIPYTQHILSKSHEKKVKMMNLLHKVVPDASKKDEISAKPAKDDDNTICVEDGVLLCKSCSTSFSGPDNAFAHVKSKKHAKNVEKYRRKLEKRKERKKSKDTDLNSSKENEGNPESKSQDETVKEALQTTPDGSYRFDKSHCETKTSKPSTSGGKTDDESVAYEKYKTYKKIMNSLGEDKILQ